MRPFTKLARLMHKTYIEDDSLSLSTVRISETSLFESFEVSLYQKASLLYIKQSCVNCS